MGGGGRDSDAAFLVDRHDLVLEGHVRRKMMR